MEKEVKLLWYMTPWMKVKADSPWPVRYGGMSFALKRWHPLFLLGISVQYWRSIRREHIRKYMSVKPWWRWLLVPGELMKNWAIFCYVVLLNKMEHASWATFIIWRNVPSPAVGE